MPAHLSYVPLLACTTIPLVRTTLAAQSSTDPALQQYTSAVAHAALCCCTLQGDFPTALAFVPNLERLNITGNHLR